MTQERFGGESTRSLNYIKIDRCQDNISIDNDEYYKQIIHSTEQRHIRQQIRLPIIAADRVHLIVLIVLIFISQTRAAPVYQTQVNYQQPALPVAMVQLSDRSMYAQQPFRVYHRLPNQQINPPPNFPNAALAEVYQPTVLAPNLNEQQLSLQLRRERQRRAMIDRMVTLFDEDGNGQLTKDELYSMALRSNIFPKFHYYLKQTPI